MYRAVLHQPAPQRNRARWVYQHIGNRYLAHHYRSTQVHHHTALLAAQDLREHQHSRTAAPHKCNPGHRYPFLLSDRHRHKPFPESRNRLGSPRNPTVCPRIDIGSSRCHSRWSHRYRRTVFPAGQYHPGYLHSRRAAVRTRCTSVANASSSGCCSTPSDGPPHRSTQPWHSLRSIHRDPPRPERRWPGCWCAVQAWMHWPGSMWEAPMQLPRSLAGCCS